MNSVIHRRASRLANSNSFNSTVDHCHSSMVDDLRPLVSLFEYISTCIAPEE